MLSTVRLLVIDCARHTSWISYPSTVTNYKIVGSISFISSTVNLLVNTLLQRAAVTITKYVCKY